MSKTNKDVIIKEIVPQTDAEKIWKEIQNLKLEMFALPGQMVNQYCQFINIEPSKCYLSFSASAVLPALELAAGSKYFVERVDRFIVVSYAQPALTVKK